SRIPTAVPIRNFYSTLDNQIIASQIGRLSAEAVPGYGGMGPAEKVRAYAALADSLPKEGSALWMRIAGDGFPVHAGVDTGLYGDDPTFPFPAAGLSRWALVPEGAFDDPAIADCGGAHPAYVLACVARSTLHQCFKPL
ncbi:MAG TPA: hypothetical protein DCP91_12075, partial [Eggerthellaceae bacterium]|nr:hypothetical protein [Eggerthellaceae bacterium]